MDRTELVVVLSTPAVRAAVAARLEPEALADAMLEASAALAKRNEILTQAALRRSRVAWSR